jgi:4-amino-4-deoxy-L-arabinose transferase-like glycosyltransferase
MTAPNGSRITDHRSLVSLFVSYALLFVGCVLFHVAGTWSVPLIDRDEPRFAEASREMIQRADYVVPYFNNQLRLDKPPLAYWAQVASYRIFGESDFSARFPSAVAAALTALVISAWGCRIGTAGLGWRAAIIFTLCLQAFLHAKAAVADMWLVLFMTIAHWAGYELLQSPTRNAQRTTPSQGAAVSKPPSALGKALFLAFYLALALGFLAKGPIAWVPLLTVGATIILARDWQLVRHFKFLCGILLILAVVALWGIPALIQTHGEFFVVGIGRHVIGRSLATMEGHGANSFGMYLLLLPFYFVTVFVSFFPWSIKLPWLVRKLWRKREAGVSDPGYSNRDKIDKYLLTGSGIIFVIFTLVATKLPHYTLPAFPLLALLLARHWPGAAATKNHGSSFGTIAIATACVLIAIALVVPPLVARFFPAYQLFRESRANLQPDMQFASVEFEEPSLVWYFRSRVQGFLTRLNKKNAVDFMSKPGPRLVIVPTSLAQTLFPNHPQAWRSRGFNIAKGKRVDLTLVLKPE